MKVPILAYHSQNILGHTYQTNDHVALARDLQTITQFGVRIVPVTWIVEWILGLRSDSDVANALAITCDDGTDFDFVDLEHPQFGLQRSFFNILTDFRQEHGVMTQPNLEITSFVIASPYARGQVDQRCMFGRGWMSDSWWKAAEECGLMKIENHSWDHNHPEVDIVAQHRQIKGNFEVIDSYRDCSAQIAVSTAYISHKTGRGGAMLFAYPWCQASRYAVEEYLPEYEREHRTAAAFGGPAGFVERTTCRWLIPRFFCGPDWHSTEQLKAILESVRRVGAGH